MLPFRPALVALLLLGAALPARAETGFLQKTLTYRGAPSRYVVYVPNSYDPARPSPCILFLHGSGETGSDGWKQVAVGLGPAIMLDAEKWGFIVIFPQKPQSEERGWIAHEKLMLDVLAKTREEYRIDASRIYCTGLSMGGRGTWDLVSRHPDLFAAAVPICGPGDPADVVKLKGVPVRAFYGDQDRKENIEQTQRCVEALKAAGGRVEFVIYPGVGHNSWDKAYREERLFEWFLRHQRK